jgi:BON domain
MAISIRTDEAIQTDVLEELQWDAHVRPNQIEVAVKDGIVTLTGWQSGRDGQPGLGDAQGRGRTCLPGERRRTRRTAPCRGQRRHQSHRGQQASCVADRPQAADRARAHPQCADRCQADHGRGAGQRGHPAGSGQFLRGEKSSGGNGQFRLGGYRGGQPYNSLAPRVIPTR